jgi:hypothetical protein
VSPTSKFIAPHTSSQSVFKFAIYYGVAGVDSYWDNNNGQNYTLMRSASRVRVQKASDIEPMDVDAIEVVVPTEVHSRSKRAAVSDQSFAYFKAVSCRLLCNPL